MSADGCFSISFGKTLLLIVPKRLSFTLYFHQIFFLFPHMGKFYLRKPLFQWYQSFMTLWLFYKVFHWFIEPSKPLLLLEAATRGVLQKKLFLKIHRKIPVLECLFNKVAGSKRYSFLWILRNFQDHLFWKTSENGCFCLVSLPSLTDNVCFGEH